VEVRWLRPATTSLIVAGLAASLSVEVDVHSHSLWEQDLRPHQLEQVERGAVRGGQPLWGGARPEHHPACAACLVAATPFDRAAPAARFDTAPRSLTLPVRYRRSFRRRNPSSPLVGRAPPDHSSSLSS
jgi:hypothetical protein